MKRLTTKCFLIISIFSVAFLSSGCSEPVKTLDPHVKSPQMVVNPGTIRLGVAKLMDTEVVFSGSGFNPEGSIIIKLLDVPVEGKKQDLSIASADVKNNGTFDAKLGTLAKVNDFLRAGLGENDEMENIIIVTGPPMPKGVYKVRAISMLSEKTAECKLNVKKPSIIDRIKDWLGVQLGKITKK